MALLSHYVASKGGVIGLTRSVAREMGGHNIHVNCITPGAIKTEAEAKVMTEEEAQAMMNFQCLQRRLMPLDIARVCLFLSTELSDGMTGQSLRRLHWEPPWSVNAAPQHLAGLYFRVKPVLGQDRSAKTNSWFRLLQTKRVDQRRECGRLLPPARVIKEESRKWLTPIIQHADKFPARQLRRHPFI